MTTSEEKSVGPAADISDRALFLIKHDSIANSAHEAFARIYMQIDRFYACIGLTGDASPNFATCAIMIGSRALLYHRQIVRASSTPDNNEQAADFLSEKMEVEYLAAAVKFGPFASALEAWAVMREELDELWQYVLADTGDSLEAGNEAIQIGAMAIRALADLRDKG